MEDITCISIWNQADVSFCPWSVVQGIITVVDESQEQEDEALVALRGLPKVLEGFGSPDFTLVCVRRRMVQRVVDKVTDTFMMLGIVCAIDHA